MVTPTGTPLSPSPTAALTGMSGLQGAARPSLDSAPRVVATQDPSIAPSLDLPRPAVEGGVNVGSGGPERDISRSSRSPLKSLTQRRTPHSASEQPPIEMTRLNPPSAVAALSPARPVANVKAVASAAAPRGRMALLARLNGEKRGVDPDKLRDAVLL